MQPGGREVHVAGNVIARADQQLGEEVFGTAPLVRRDQLLVDGAVGLIEAAVGGRAVIEQAKVLVDVDDCAEEIRTSDVAEERCGAATAGVGPDAARILDVVHRGDEELIAAQSTRERNEFVEQQGLRGEGGGIGASDVIARGGGDTLPTGADAIAAHRIEISGVEIFLARKEIPPALH